MNDSRSGNRRTSRRVELDVAARFESDGDWFPGLAIDVSTDGLFAITRVVHEVGERFRVFLSLPGQGSPLDLTAEVRWAHALDLRRGEMACMGLRFVDVPTRAARALRRFITPDVGVQRRPALSLGDDMWAQMVFG